MAASGHAGLHTPPQVGADPAGTSAEPRYPGAPAGYVSRAPWKTITLGQMKASIPGYLAPGNKTCKALYLCPVAQCPVLGYVSADKWRKHMEHDDVHAALKGRAKT